MKNEQAAAAARLDSLQAARGVAALLVILFHCSLAIFSHPVYWPHDPFAHVFAWGNQGVELFFAISGFVILTAHRRDIGRPDALVRYASRRFQRIYPVYWVTLLLLLPAYALEPSWDGGLAGKPLILLSSFLLVHLGTASVVMTVSWTLFLEVVFYAVFAALLLGRGIGIAVLGIWWSLAVLRLFAGPIGPLGLYLFEPYTLLFGFGMAAAALHRAAIVRRPGLLALAGTVLFVGNGLLSAFHPLIGSAGVTLISGGASAAALAGVAGLERDGRLRIGATLLLIGDASYSIYLVHFPALSLFAKLLLPRAALVLPPILVALALVVAAVAAGIVFHLAVERPLIRSARSGRGRERAAELRPSIRTSTRSRHAAGVPIARPSE